MSKGSIVLESSIVCFRTRGGKFLVDPVAKSIIRIVVALSSESIDNSKSYSSAQSVHILILILIGF